MKKLIYSALLVFASVYSVAQDVIVKKNGEDIKVKVIEVGLTDIKYKRFDYQDGPVYVLPKSDIMLIRYENGVNEVIGVVPTSPEPTPSNTTVNPPVEAEKASEKIDYLMGSYSQGGRYISRTRLFSVLRNTKDEQIMRLLTKSNSSRVTGNVIASAVGIPLMVFGTMTTLVGVSKMVEDVDPDAKGITTVGAVMAGTGIFVQFMNIGFQSKSRKAIVQAIEIYNTKYADQGKPKE